MKILRAPSLRLVALGLLSCVAGFAADTVTIDIDAAKPGPEINPRLYGIFLEEINTGVDGGLYAELIRNRGFEDAKAPEGFVLRNDRWDNGRGYVIPYRFEVDKSLPYWSLIKAGGAEGSMSLDLTNSLNPATPRSCRLEIQNASGRIGIVNEGYWGIGVKAGEKYLLSFWARGADFRGPLSAVLETENGETDTDTVKISKVATQWKKYTATLTAKKTDPHARFALIAGAKGTVWLDMISLFPQKTFKGRANGLRPEIAQMIADLKPGFVRFPGGCVVEGATPENAYDWKQSIGPIEEREEIWNVWDYRRTHGMGFFEYLQFCEDLGAEPMYVGFAGQTCIYRRSTNVPMAEMQPIEDSFLDALQFANGPANSRWGKLRAAAGHRAPFNLKMVEIGNENTGRQYEERYAAIYPLIKTNYPNITALANFPQRNSPTEMVDEHYYNSPRWFINNLHLYDKRDRNSPPVYIAEVAVTSAEGGRDKGNLTSALAEGVFLMGVERNADVVRMVSYAPLLANVHGRTELAGAPPPWHGMIYFDSSRVFGTVSYQLWKLFGENRPSRTVKTDVTFPGDADVQINRPDRRRHLGHQRGVQGCSRRERRPGPLQFGFFAEHGRLASGRRTTRRHRPMDRWRRRLPSRTGRPGFELQRRRDVVGLHAHPQGAQTQRRRRFPRHVRPQSRRYVLVEPRRLGQYPSRHRTQRPGSANSRRTTGRRPDRNRSLV